MQRLIASILFLSLSPLQNATAELLPNQVAVIANSTSKESMQLALEYAHARKIPEQNILSIACNASENISYKDFEKTVREPIRKQLLSKKISAKIKSLALVYGIPLHVQAPDVGDRERKIIEDAGHQLRNARHGLLVIKRKAKDLAGETPDAELGKLATTEEEDRNTIHEIEKLLQTASSHAQSLPASEQQAATKNLTQVIGALGGFSAILQFIRPTPGASEAQTGENIKRFQGETENIKQVVQALDQTPGEVNRKRAYALSEKIYGVVGTLRRAAIEQNAYSYQEADASVDSELSLLWWGAQIEQTSGKLPNPLYHISEQISTQLIHAMPVLLVSRLDGPTPEAVSKLIANSILAENSGLSGNVHIDTRGKKLDKSDVFSVWDENMSGAGWLIRNKTKLSVNIDKHEELIERAPNTALYVGWYQLRKFQGDFSFAPGGIAYHIASEEAVSLHNQAETGWCINLLAQGAVATLGAVAEPYLEEFPLPLELVGLLLTGKYSLAEAYYLSTPHLSWRLTLIGDPLYNPWKNAGYNKITVEDLKSTAQDTAAYITFPPEPGKIIYANPEIATKALTEQKKKVQQNLDNFFKNLENQKAKTN